MTERPASTPPAEPSALDDYQKVAETVGMMPSLRWKDNVFQAVAVIACGGIGAIVGAIIWGAAGAAGLGVAGLIAGTLISGFVLMILGWVRATKSRR